MVIVEIQVCRNVDRVEVAKLLTRKVSEPVTRAVGDSIRAEARRLSKVYGGRYHVEVWAWYPHLGGDAYHRAYVYVNGKTAQAVGF
jgi:hypothetical protein